MNDENDATVHTDPNATLAMKLRVSTRDFSASGTSQWSSVANRVLAGAFIDAVGSRYEHGLTSIMPNRPTNNAK